MEGYNYAEIVIGQIIHPISRRRSGEFGSTVYYYAGKALPSDLMYVCLDRKEFRSAVTTFPVWDRHVRSRNRAVVGVGLHLPDHEDGVALAKFDEKRLKFLLKRLPDIRQDVIRRLGELKLPKGSINIYFIANHDSV